MLSKKGYIKTLEAVIAIITIIVVSYALIVKNIEKTPDPPLILQDAMSFITENVELDESLRENITRRKPDARNDIESIIIENKPKDYDFICLICSGTKTCLPPAEMPIEKNIYVSDVFIASSIQSSIKTQDPHVVRIWFWKKPTPGYVSQDWLNKCDFL